MNKAVPLSFSQGNNPCPQMCVLPGLRVRRMAPGFTSSRTPDEEDVLEPIIHGISEHPERLVGNVRRVYARARNGSLYVICLEETD